VSIKSVAPLHISLVGLFRGAILLKKLERMYAQGKQEVPPKNF